VLDWLPGGVYLRYPKIKPVFDVFYLKDEPRTAMFYSPAVSLKVLVEDRFTFEKSLLLMDGSKSVDEIASIVGREKEPVLDELVMNLELNGVLEEPIDFGLLEADLAGFIKKHGSTRTSAELLVVCLKGTGLFLRKLFDSIGFKKVRVVEADPQGNYLEAVTTGSVALKKPCFVFCFLNSTYWCDCRELNEFFVARKIPCLYSFTDGLVGPLVFSKESACLECMVSRFDGLLEVIPERYTLISGEHKNFGAGKQLMEWLLKKSIEALVFAVSEPSVEVGEFKSSPVCLGFVLNYWGNKKMRLVKMESCRACSSRCELNGFVPPKSAVLKLTNREYASTENGLRAVHPKETLEKAKEIIGGLGVVTDLAVNKVGKYSASSSDPTSPKLSSLLSKRTLLRMRVHAGKGVTPEQAKASAVMEAVERYCGKYQGSEPEVEASFDEVKGIAVNPLDFFIGVGEFESYSSHKKINWVWGYSLADNKPVLVPSVLAFLAYFNQKNARFPHYDSNGLAAGNCIEEAILHGLLEVLERDAAYIVELNGLCMPDLDINGVNDEIVKKVLFEIKEKKLGLYLKDFTNDLGIPSIGVFLESRGNSSDGLQFSSAVGTHLKPEIALLRALTEALSVFPRTQSKGSTLYKIHENWRVKGKRTTVFGSLKDFSTGNIKGDVLKCVELLKSKGYKTYIVDFSREAVPFSVARVLVSGVQPVYLTQFPRVSPRLKEVPVLLGFKPRVCQANLVGMFDVFWRISTSS